MTKLLDCTTRDGGHVTNWNYSDEYIFSLLEDLNKKRINFYEIGYRNYFDREGKGEFYYCLPDFLKKFYDKKGDLKLGIMVDTKRYNENDFIDAHSDHVDFIRIATHPDRIIDTLKIAEDLCKKNYYVMVQLMDITKLTPEHYEILANWKQKNIIETLYLADTYGITDNLEKIYNKIKECGYKNISFHAHDKMQRALKNSLKAIELGAYSIDISHSSDGINGGNLQYQQLADLVII